MNKLSLSFFFLILIFFSNNVLGQEPGDLRYPSDKALIKGIIHQYNTATGVCSDADASFDIGTQGEIQFVSNVQSDTSKYIIDVIHNNANAAGSKDNFATINNQYWVTNANYKTWFRSTPFSSVRTSYGLLMVPFKLRFAPTTVTPGGDLGGYLGWYIARSQWLFAVHAGLTFVSLNDVNAQTPQTKTGFTGGLAFINDISSTFQIGFVSGVDVFDGADTWAYRYNPWVSLQIGFKFTK